MRYRLAAAMAIALFLSTAGYRAQSIIEKGEDKIRLFNARSDMNGWRHRDALRTLLDLAKSNPDDGTVMGYIGECYYELGEFDPAIEYLEKAKNMTSSPYADTRLFLGKTYHMKGEADKAIEELTAYRKSLTSDTKIRETEIDHHIAQANSAKELIAKPVNVKITNMGNKINSQYADKKTSVTADGKKMIFTTRRPGNKGGKVDKEADNKYFEDIYVSSWDSIAKNWGEAEPMPGSINTEGHDACTSISPDGKQVFVYLNNKNTGSGDIFVSRVSNTGRWGAPKTMGKPINSSYYEDAACLTPDGKTLYFVSERPKGGMGMGDIWMVTQVSKKEWGDPVNLGPEINTPYDENGVYIHPDGKTLFFSSQGHNAMGKHDLFMTRNENGKWSKPVNLGYPINSLFEDKNFILTTDGKTAYMTSDRPGGLGEDDIYMVDLSEYSLLGGEKEKKKSSSGLSILKGQLINSEAAQGVEGEISIYNENGEKINTLNSTAEGDYFITLPGGKNYEVRVELRGFDPVSEKFLLPLDERGDTYTLVKHLLLRKEKK